MTKPNAKRPRRPTDFNQRAKLIVDLATGQTTQEEFDKLPPVGREISGQARQAQKRAKLAAQSQNSSG